MNKVDRAIKRLYKRFNTYNPYSICKDMDIPVIRLKLNDIKGFTVEHKNINTIVINEELENEEELFTLGHELGHIVMEHSFNMVFMTRRTYLLTDKYEREANLFSYLLLSKYYESIGVTISRNKECYTEIEKLINNMR